MALGPLPSEILRRETDFTSQMAKAGKPCNGGGETRRCMHVIVAPCRQSHLTPPSLPWSRLSSLSLWPLIYQARKQLHLVVYGQPGSREVPFPHSDDLPFRATGSLGSSAALSLRSVSSHTTAMKCEKEKLPNVILSNGLKTQDTRLVEEERSRRRHLLYCMTFKHQYRLYLHVALWTGLWTGLYCGTKRR